MQSHSDEIGIPDELATLVGKIAIEWSFIEARLQVILATLIGKDVALGLSVTSNMGVKSIQDTLLSLAGSATASIPTFGPHIEAILGEVARLVSIRNTLVHGQWERPEGDGLWPLIIIRFKGKTQNRLEVWSRQQIISVLLDCGALSEALHQFMIRHEIYDDTDAYVEQRSSRGTQLERRPAAPLAQNPKYKALLHQPRSSRA